MLKIYSDKSYILQGKKPVILLFPFWHEEGMKGSSRGRFAHYMEIGETLFRLTTLQEADLAVFPTAWEHICNEPNFVSKARQFIDLAKDAGKPVVLFFFSDSDERVPYDGTVIFRTSLYRSTKQQNEHALPAWSEDFVENYLNGDVRMRNKRPKAVVGFCGYVPPLPRHPVKRAYRAIKERIRGSYRLKKDFSARVRAIDLLKQSRIVETNFIFRDAFHAGVFLPDQQMDSEQARAEFLQNMLESDYILCSRGMGNFSYRFYEALSCGRVPVFVDTDCVLPYHSDIHWRDYCVWVEYTELDRIAEKVQSFHDGLSQSQFRELQMECRSLWKRYLTPEGFFQNFHKHFR